MDLTYLPDTAIFYDVLTGSPTYGLPINSNHISPAQTSSTAAGIR